MTNGQIYAVKDGKCSVVIVPHNGFDVLDWLRERGVDWDATPEANLLDYYSWRLAGRDAESLLSELQPTRLREVLTFPVLGDEPLDLATTAVYERLDEYGYIEKTRAALGYEWDDEEGPWYHYQFYSSIEYSPIIDFDQRRVCRRSELEPNGVIAMIEVEPVASPACREALAPAPVWREATGETTTVATPRDGGMVVSVLDSEGRMLSGAYIPDGLWPGGSTRPADQPPQIEG